MSETKKYTGLVRKSELTVEQVVEKIMGEMGRTPSIDWYDSHEDFMVVFVQGKVKVFGKRGKYLGEYNESDFR